MNKEITFGDFNPEHSYQEREGAYGIVFQGNLVLIEKAQLGYFLPGGGLEEGETPEAALQREFKEETGYELVSYTKLGTGVEYREELKKIGHFYLVELGEKGQPTYDDGHVFPVEWTAYDAALDGMHLASQKWAILEALDFLQATQASI